MNCFFIIGCAASSYVSTDNTFYAFGEKTFTQHELNEQMMEMKQQMEDDTEQKMKAMMEQQEQKMKEIMDDHMLSLGSRFQSR